MTRRRLAAASAGLLMAGLLTAGAWAGTATAGAASAAAATGTPGYCPTGDGVTVVVDFQVLGGGIVVRCAPGPLGTGLDALRDAGFTPTGVRQYGLAFVCRIEDQPAADQTLPIEGDPNYHESCEHTPPQQAFWGYWYAPNGGRWSYSQAGAINHDAIRGGFEGWSFSLNHPAGQSPPPGIAPRRPPQSPPPPTTPPTTRPTHRPPTTPPTTSPTRHPTTSPRPSGRPTRTRGSSGPTGSLAPTPTSAPGTAGAGTGQRPDGARRTAHTSAVPVLPTGTSPAIAPAADPVAAGHNAAGEHVSGQLPTAGRSDGGSAGTVALGLGVVAVLAVGGGIAARRRRTSRE